MKFYKLFWFLVPILGLFMADATTGGGGEPADPGDGEPGTAPKPEPTKPAPPAADPAQAGPDEGDDEPPDEKTFTQAELDKKIADRLKRERGKYADYNDLKKKAAAFDEAEKAKLDEVERLQLELKEAQEAVSKAVSEAQTQAIASAVMSEAAKADFIDPAVAYKLATLDDISYENGEVIGAAEAVKAVAESHPYLIKQPPQPGQPPSPTNPARRGPVGRTDDERRREYLGGGVKTPFFSGGGVVNPVESN